MSEELREAIAVTAARWESAPFDPEPWQVSNGRDLADALLSGPLAPLLAAKAAVERVEALAERFNDPVRNGSFPGQTALFGGGDVCWRIRRALDGTP